MSSGSRPARARAAPTSLPRGKAAATRKLVRWLPSVRSLLLGLALAAGGALAYVGARETPIFAVRTIAVSGAPPRVAAHVRAALAPLEGQSLVGLSAAAVEHRLAALPDVARFSYDRAFPHTVRVAVTAEWPVAVLRRGADAWIVATSGRVIGRVQPARTRRLARVWVPKDTAVSPGANLADPRARQAVRALAAVRTVHLGARVRLVRTDGGELTLVLRAGTELRLGDPSQLGLKLVIARRILPLVRGTGYLDVSAPDRPVAGISLSTLK